MGDSDRQRHNRQVAVLISVAISLISSFGLFYEPLNIEARNLFHTDVNLVFILMFVMGLMWLVFSLLQGEREGGATYQSELMSPSEGNDALNGAEVLEREILATNQRLLSEINRLGFISNVYLAVGIAIGFLGVLILAVGIPLRIEQFQEHLKDLLITPKTESAISNKDVMSIAIYYVPRFFIGAFIEVFAFFFLRLYRDNLQELASQNDELTQVQSRIVALRLATISNDDRLKQSVVTALCRHDRRTVPVTRAAGKNKKEAELIRKVVDEFMKYIGEKKENSEVK